MSESLRRRAGFKKHLHLDWPGRKADGTMELIVKSGEGPTWISAASAKVPEWRADVRDVYMRWAITINAMHVARDHYAADPLRGLETRTLRADRTGAARIVVLDTWSGADTARNYGIATPVLAAYGFADLFGLFEEIVFELYLIFLDGNPGNLLAGDEYKPLKRLHRNRESDDAAREKWEAAWAERLAKWRRKRGYDGLHKVFASFYRDAGLRRPSDFKQSDVQDWCDAIQAIAELRNCITHGVSEVTPELEALSAKVPSDVYAFEKGRPLEVSLGHLMFMECFLDQMLHTIGASLLEKAFGPVLSMRPG